jgi:predicted transposase YdaD
VRFSNHVTFLGFVQSKIWFFRIEGMSFDSTCRRLAEQFPEDFASWLLGRPIDSTVLNPTELSLEPIRADNVMLLEGESDILHIEWQTDPK